jgi:hypothetical protein
VILRLAAAASLCLGAAVLLAYLVEVGKSPWSNLAARQLRAMKERTEEPSRYEPMTIAEMAALPRDRPVGEYSAYERRGVAVEGYVQRMLRASDGDTHLDVAPAIDPHHELVPYLSMEIDPHWLRGSQNWRFERLVERLHPYYGGEASWDSAPARVRLRGWLMYDYPYEGSPPVRGFPPHLAQWEVHPVTGIEVWDERTAAFVEVPR